MITILWGRYRLGHYRLPLHATSLQNQNKHHHQKTNLWLQYRRDR